MSSNDLIMLYKEKGVYVVRHVDADYPSNTYSRSTHKTLLAAVRKAKKIQNEDFPEYGITVGRL